MTESKDTKKPVEMSPLRPKYAEKTPPCVSHCPNGVDIRGWLTTIAQAEAYGRTDEQALELAWQKIMDLNPFPAICGRVCPHPCEAECNRKDKDGSVAINALERFVGDFGIAKGLKPTSLSENKCQDKIAVIGSGPAGLSCAYQLSRRGFPVTVYEAFSQPGGMLRYGIPKYRLPREVLDAEIQRILDLGIELKCGVIVGKDIPFEQLRHECKAIFVGIGAHKGLKLGVPGENAGNILTGIEFLNHANSGESLQVGNKVDCDRRRGHRYRRSQDQPAPGRRGNYTLSPDPGRDAGHRPGKSTAHWRKAWPLNSLPRPSECCGITGRLQDLTCIRMEVGNTRRLRQAATNAHRRDLNLKLKLQPLSPQSARNLNSLPVAELREGKDWIRTDEWGATQTAGIYAGGDDLELALVATAVYQGRMAAQAIEAHVRGGDLTRPGAHPPATKVIADWHMETDRHERQRLPVDLRDMDAEIEQSLSQDDAVEEAKRCMSCGMCMDCESCWMYCTNNCFVRLPKGEHYSVKMDLCNGCKKCAEGCPTGYLELF